MNKYLKISLVSTALYIGLGLALYVLGESYNSGIGFGQGIFGNIAACWSGGALSSSCYFGMGVVDDAVFYIPYHGMILAAFVSAITGLIAVYKTLKAQARSWHVITIYGTLNALLVFGSVLLFFTI